MAPLGILIFATFAIVGTPAPNAPHPHSLFCTGCHGVRNLARCTQVIKCHGDEICFTDIRVFNGENYYFKGCKKEHDCMSTVTPSSAMVGKRAPIHEKDTQLICEMCCRDQDCNSYRSACDEYMTTTTIPITTPEPSSVASTVASTLQPTLPPVTLSGCRDHEEDGFNCTTYDQYKFCSVTDPTTLSYTIAHDKCPQHCGFCTVTTTTTPVPTTTPVCVDHEEDGFICADYDQYNFCTDTSSIAYSLAHKKCPKHCGFCGAGAVTAQTNGAANPVTLTSNHAATSTMAATTANAPLFASVVISQSSTARPCADFEDATFSCASWASNGFCQSPTGVLHEITVMRCSKYCGLC